MSRDSLSARGAVDAASDRHGAKGVAREVGRGLFVLGLTGSSVGGVVSVLTLASRMLGR